MRFLGLMAVSVTVLLATASSAAARPDFRCDGVFKGKTYDEVVVPRGGACTLIDSRVTGDVKALKSAYFQATGTVVRGDIHGKEAQTIFIDTGSKVSSLTADRAIQVFIFNSTVIYDIQLERTREVVQVCGTTVRKGDIVVERSGPDKGVRVAERPGTDILIGDPLAEGCRGNLVKRGDVKITRNFTDLEFVIRGNTIKRGDLKVLKNNGPAPKFVESNIGGDGLVCRSSLPLTARNNTGWDYRRGQCA
jgi:hypothetical protein